MLPELTLTVIECLNKLLSLEDPILQSCPIHIDDKTVMLMLLLQPHTIPRDHSEASATTTGGREKGRCLSPGLHSAGSCDHFNLTAGETQLSTKQVTAQPNILLVFYLNLFQNSRHSFSYDSSLPRSPPPYQHPGGGAGQPGLHYLAGLGHHRGGR